MRRKITQNPLVCFILERSFRFSSISSIGSMKSVFLSTGDERREGGGGTQKMDFFVFRVELMELSCEKSAQSKNS